ncbi:hypothetical protein [Streptomyces sp. NPDC060194]|uniref:hypothetical protein n=1 Tax=Streptomyces sp. NPDC060194 TaxID=3347069 RepID=UPI003648D6F9
MTDHACVAPAPEPQAAAFAAATATPPFPYQLPPAEGRKAVEGAQSGDVGLPAVDEARVSVVGGPIGEVRARIVRPAGTRGERPVDEGEGYAAWLRRAGAEVTAVRVQGVIHGFVLLDGLRGTQGARVAVALDVSTLRTALAAP